MEIQENPLMELELVVSSPLVELSDIDVTRDIIYQGPPTEHVKHLEDGLVIKPYVKVKLGNIGNIENKTFMTDIRGISSYA